MVSKISLRDLLLNFKSSCCLQRFSYNCFWILSFALQVYISTISYNTVTSYLIWNNYIFGFSSSLWFLLIASAWLLLCWICRWVGQPCCILSFFFWHFLICRSCIWGSLVFLHVCRYFMYDGLKHTCVEGNHIVNIFSFSKAYGMMGWRVGYVSNTYYVFIFISRREKH